LDEALHPWLVPGCQAHALVHAEPGVFPAPDVLDHFLGFEKALDGFLRMKMTAA
jgi:hypothetical protein